LKSKVEKSKEEWKRALTPEEFHILREKGTERAFTGKYFDLKEKGTYLCAGCQKKLFSSKTKYDSGTGWPSFYAPISKDSVEIEPDEKLLVSRTEVLCSRCGGHLGHVFDDGPKPSGKRFCINSAALRFEREKEGG
jgi:peptide-methionine (R)-S-oxide reductase